MLLGINSLCTLLLSRGRAVIHITLEKMYHIRQAKGCDCLKNILSWYSNKQQDHELCAANKGLCAANKGLWAANMGLWAANKSLCAANKGLFASNKSLWAAIKACVLQTRACGLQIKACGLQIWVCLALQIRACVLKDKPHMYVITILMMRV